MTIEMAADCVKACNNAGDNQVLAQYELFEHFIDYFGFDTMESQQWFASLCGFGLVKNVT